jgi:hypothetical protein
LCGTANSLRYKRLPGHFRAVRRKDLCKEEGFVYCRRKDLCKEEGFVQKRNEKKRKNYIDKLPPFFYITPEIS